MRPTRGPDNIKKKVKKEQGQTKDVHIRTRIK